MPTKGPQASVVSREVERFTVGAELRRRRLDAVVVEEPLEIRVAGDALAVTMRTPGQDRELAIGFAYAEGLFSSIQDLGSVYHCGRLGQPTSQNVIEILPGPGCHFDPDVSIAARRGTLTTAACGVCGRQTIDDLLQRCEPLSGPDGSGSGPDTVTVAQVLSNTKLLGEFQPDFAASGGAHAALVVDHHGARLTSAEDVGRHNAVDKVVGGLLLAGKLDMAQMLVVSGRVSFEIVQKAAVARIPILVAVSAPSSLAVDLAAKLRITLIGFARGEGLNIYCHGGRIV